MGSDSSVSLCLGWQMRPEAWINVIAFKLIQLLFAFNFSDKKGKQKNFGIKQTILREAWPIMSVKQWLSFYIEGDAQM